MQDLELLKSLLPTKEEAILWLKIPDDEIPIETALEMIRKGQNAERAFLGLPIAIREIVYKNGSRQKYEIYATLQDLQRLGLLDDDLTDVDLPVDYLDEFEIDGGQQ
jgi:hypothetical protein